MIPFEHFGPEHPAIRWSRTALLGFIVAAGTILLFPFTLLMLFLRGLGYLVQGRGLSPRGH